MPEPKKQQAFVRVAENLYRCTASKIYYGFFKRGKRQIRMASQHHETTRAHRIG